ncbi:hypothetical protein FRX31_019031 [Thalictrum thalictroides]|uniref:Uncharacterized protein n=1 Tax=Thalictrum thalictroides TaxID=46969 RepID=A0A7J6W4D6_THATH|nr:hypothetical protein FRX31_019031 [Thalictrum thalictroides]
MLGWVTVLSNIHGPLWAKTTDLFSHVVFKTDTKYDKSVIVFFDGNVYGPSLLGETCKPQALSTPSDH